MPYVKNYGVFACPSRPKDTCAGYTRPLAYGMNDAAGLEGPISMIRNPAKSILVGERVADNWGPYMDPGFPEEPYYVGRQYHNMMPNWVFCDGHATAMRVRATIKPVFMWFATRNPPCYIYGLGDDLVFVRTVADAQKALTNWLNKLKLY